MHEMVYFPGSKSNKEKKKEIKGRIDFNSNELPGTIDERGRL